METERKATPRQLAYIQHLRKKLGKESMEIEGELDFQDASVIINGLIEKAGQKAKPQSQKINEPRLGMAMKENFRLFRHYQKEIFGKHKEWFKEEVIKTYQLFTEIAEELGSQPEK